MFLQKLNDKPSPKKAKFLIILGFFMCFIAIPIMQYFSGVSGYPANILASQLSFNGELLKSYYSLTNIFLYRISTSLDYIFMAGYGIILFSSSVLIARKYTYSSRVQKIGFLVALFGIIAAICDGIENIFILLMLTDPSTFPNVWAITHSVFALIKWILLFIVITWIITAGVINLIKRKKV